MAAPPVRQVRADRDVHARLVRSPFVVSFIGRARPGDLEDADSSRRAAAWANWAVESLIEVSTGERSYSALRLEGAFYDPRNQGPRVIPHLEIPRRRLETPDDEFPDRLAQMGNGLRFVFWMYSEVTALRRALFNTASGPVRELCDLLDERRADLVTGLTLVNRQAEPRWATLAGLILSTPDGLSEEVTADFSTTEVAAYLPAAAELGLKVVYDDRLREKNGPWASRRIGVWQLHGETPGGDEFSLGVVTPRLTVNSLFADPLFVPERESSSALLVRALLLRRLVRRHLAGSDEFQVGEPAPARPRAHLRAVPARTGQKLPEASVQAALHFLEGYPDPSAAWGALESWSARGYVMTVTEEGFTAAHRRAARALRRMEDPDRADIDCLLPLAWDTREGRAQVVRVTYAEQAGGPGDPS